MNRSDTTIVTSLAALSLALSAGCFSGDSAAPPGGSDAAAPDLTPDATTEAGAEAGGSSVVDAAVEASEPAEDAAAEAGMDATVVVTVDAGLDAAVDVGVDAAIDAGVDASIDAGTEAGPADAAIEPAEAGTVAIGTTNTQVITVGDDAPLYINDNHAVWSYGSATEVAYANLPPELDGTVGNDTVNTSTPVTFTLTATTTCYLIRQDQWTSVDLSGWVAIDHAAYYFTGYDNNTYGPATIYSQTFPAGVYNWNTYSAMYACAE